MKSLAVTLAFYMLLLLLQLTLAAYEQHQQQRDWSETCEHANPTSRCNTQIRHCARSNCEGAPD